MKIYHLLLCFASLLPSTLALAQSNSMMRAMVGVTPSCAPLTLSSTPRWSNLAGLWHFDGSLGAIPNSSSIVATVGTAGTVVNPSGTLAYATGAATRLSQGISASGNANDYLNLGNPAALNDLTAGTWMMWVNVPLNTAMTFFYKSDGNGSAGWFFWIDSTMHLGWKSVFSSTNPYVRTSALTSMAGVWSQVVVTWDGSILGSGINIYLNGVLQTPEYSQDGVGSHTTDAAENFYVGKDGPSAAGANFSGVMDELAVWNVVLTPSEIAALYRYQKCN